MDDDRNDSDAKGDTVTAEEGKPNHKRYRKDKPWDDETIDHWKPVSVTTEDPLPAPLEESAFAVKFPTYREKYIREVWPLVTRTLKQYGLGCELNLIEGTMTVKTTRKTWDPYAIMKARDLIRLLSRSFPVQQAVKIMSDEMNCDVIKIKGMVRNKQRFVKRRQRLIGPNGCTLKAIELVTDCYVLVQGNTVSAMGSYKGLKWVRKIVEDCMKNVHPIYNIKSFMIKKELSKDPTLKDQNWDRFLPSFKKKNVKRKNKKPIEKREYTPFPPAQTPRKVDLQLESGEYFMSQQQKVEAQEQKRREKNLANKLARNKKRAEEYVAPAEDTGVKAMATDTGDELQRLKAKFTGGKRKKRKAASETGQLEDYVMDTRTPDKTKARKTKPTDDAAAVSSGMSRKEKRRRRAEAHKMKLAQGQ